MIENLKSKLIGEFPVNRSELFYLISSWGRIDDFETIEYDLNQSLMIYEIEPKECYDLSNLDVSQIIDFSDTFCYSLFNGDISKWDVSNANNMNRMFYSSEFNGDISKWNISNVNKFLAMFKKSDFCGDISKWNFNKNMTLHYIFQNNENFENKYNYGKEIPYISEDFLKWFEENKLNIANANVTKEELVDIDDYLISFSEEKTFLKH